MILVVVSEGFPLLLLLRNPQLVLVFFVSVDLIWKATIEARERAQELVSGEGDKIPAWRRKILERKKQEEEKTEVSSPPISLSNSQSGDGVPEWQKRVLARKEKSSTASPVSLGEKKATSESSPADSNIPEWQLRVLQKKSAAPTVSDSSQKNESLKQPVVTSPEEKSRLKSVFAMWKSKE